MLSRRCTLFICVIGNIGLLKSVLALYAFPHLLLSRIISTSQLIQVIHEVPSRQSRIQSKCTAYCIHYFDYRYQFDEICVPHSNSLFTSVSQWPKLNSHTILHCIFIFISRSSCIQTITKIQFSALHMDINTYLYSVHFASLFVSISRFTYDNLHILLLWCQ